MTNIGCKISVWIFYLLIIISLLNQACNLIDSPNDGNVVLSIGLFLIIVIVIGPGCIIVNKINNKLFNRKE